VIRQEQYGKWRDDSADDHPPAVDSAHDQERREDYARIDEAIDSFQDEKRTAASAIASCPSASTPGR
jgi:hypothetical protein